MFGWSDFLLVGITYLPWYPVCVALPTLPILGSPRYSQSWPRPTNCHLQPLMLSESRTGPNFPVVPAHRRTTNSTSESWLSWRGWKPFLKQSLNIGVNHKAARASQQCLLHAWLFSSMIVAELWSFYAILKDVLTSGHSIFCQRFR